MHPIFITLVQTNGDVCHINARQIRAVSPYLAGASVNIGTAADIPVVEKPSVVLARIDDAFS